MSDSQSQSSLLLRRQLKGNLTETHRKSITSTTNNAFSRICVSSARNVRTKRTELSRNPVQGFSAGLADDSNIYEWELMIMGPEGTLYEGGFFKAKLIFPKEYPLLPPKMTFVSDIWHPNVYANGDVCISILHAPGEDKYGYESASERWLPIHTVETIVLSVISMLSSPNDESPANIEAAKEWREDEKAFKKRVQRCVRRSLED